MNNFEEKNIVMENIDHAMSVFGNYDENIKIIESSFDVKITARDNELKIIGESISVNKAHELINKLVEISKKGDDITKQNVNYYIQLINDGQLGSLDNYSGDVVCVTIKGRKIKAKTQGQKNYVDRIRNNDIVSVSGQQEQERLSCVSMAVMLLKAKRLTNCPHSSGR